MCGRYQLGLKGKNKLFGYRFSIDEQQTSKLKDNFNVAPSNIMPIIVKHRSNVLKMMLWGLIPSWSKDGKNLVINARLETLFVKPMFKRVIKTQRCIIPSTGFYEWKKTSEGKQPYFIGLKNSDFFGFAGLYDIWKNSMGKEIYSYSIITCCSNIKLKEIHNRMPVILKKEDETHWLNTNNVKTEELLPFLQPYPENQINAYPISTRVNSPFYNDPDIALPIN